MHHMHVIAPRALWPAFQRQKLPFGSTDVARRTHFPPSPVHHVTWSVSAIRYNSAVGGGLEVQRSSALVRHPRTLTLFYLLTHSFNYAAVHSSRAPT